VKVGLLVGRETVFPEALIERINSKDTGVTAEMIKLGGTTTDEAIPYRVIIDRISHEVYYYRAYLKKAVLDGVTVVNNPFWWSADDKFFECALAQNLGVAIPKTIVLPSREFVADIVDESLRNLERPLNWAKLTEYTGLPAVLKPAIGGGNKNIHLCESIEELQQAYDTSGELLMILQERIQWDNYVRCYCVGRKHVLVSRYDHFRPRAERYVAGMEGISDALYDRIVQDALTLNHALGYDMNTVEFAIRDGVPYAIDFLNPAPDSDRASIGPERFEWVVEHMANMAIEYAQQEPSTQAELRWQTMLNAAPAVPSPS